MLDTLTNFINAVATQLVGSIESGSYLGITLLMAVESSFIPFPSEIVMIPAGFLAYQGKLNFFLVVLSGLVGSIIGSLINYYLALVCGRPILEKYGRYIFIKPAALDKVDHIFSKHGEIVIFTARLIPGIRQLISLPAGMSRMSMPKFLFYTSLGAGLWMLILSVFGYWIGSQQMAWQEAWQKHSGIMIVSCMVLCGLGLAIYWLKQRRAA